MRERPPEVKRLSEIWWRSAWSALPTDHFTLVILSTTSMPDRTVSYYPYYSHHWPGVSLSFGWGYGSSWPYYMGGYYGSPGYSVGVYAPYVAAGGDDNGAPPPPARDAERSHAGRSGRVRLEVRPDDTSVYVDDEFRGTARETKFMNLPPGRHLIELGRPGFATERREVTAVSGESQDVLVELLRP